LSLALPRAEDQGRCAPAFPRKRPTQLRAESPTWGLAALNLGRGETGPHPRRSKPNANTSPKVAGQDADVCVSGRMSRSSDRHLTVVLNVDGWHVCTPGRGGEGCRWKASLFSGTRKGAGTRTDCGGLGSLLRQPVIGISQVRMPATSWQTAPWTWLSCSCDDIG
jgi:hypothetical protein